MTMTTTMTTTTTRAATALALLLFGLSPATSPAAAAATPPDRIHYQGVLRDAADAPLDGSYAMVFRFYDAETGGSELLVNQPAPVDVAGGLFGVELGSGSVTDGAGPGVYAALADVFAAFDSVWLEIQVGGETLSPRVRVAASAYALNAGRLGGRDAAGFVDTSSAPQVKTGALALGDLDVGGTLTIAGGTPGPGKLLTSDGAGVASWQDAPPEAELAPLTAIAARLESVDPAELPFAALESFDCSGGATATMVFEVGGSALGTVAGFVGRDAISTTYEYLVALRSTTPIVSEAQIGATGRLSLQRGGTTTTFSGRITEFGLAGADGADSIYVARVEPLAERLDRSTGYHAIQAAGLLDVVDSELATVGVAPVHAIAGTYPPREWTVQYGESGLEFITRLTEQDGVHFHFREGGAGEELVLGDQNGAFTAVAGTIPYYGDMVDPGTGEERISTFHARSRQASASAVVRAYDFTAPAATIEQSASAPGGGVGELYEFYADGVDGSRAAALAQAAIGRDQTRSHEHSGTGNAVALKAGHTFGLNDESGAGFGGSYVVTDITHFALSDSDPTCVRYGNVFHAIPAGVTYRPPRVTPRPVVDGPITAVVTGPAGETVYADSYGRVKVQFHWDREGGLDETSSGWVRAAVPSGQTDNRRYVPEVGDEVVVGFLQGDPDRPVILGSLYNDDELPPVDDSLVLDGTTISINADGPGADQSIYFHDGVAPTNEYLRWEQAAGRFRISDDLVVDDLLAAGNDVDFGTGAGLTSSSTTTLFVHGVDPTDDVLLYAGNSIGSGAIRMFGGSNIELRPGSGLVTFVNGSTSVQTAALDAAGNLQIDGDLTVSGGDVVFGVGARLQATTGAFNVFGGLADTDDLVLRAGNTADDGEITIFGDGAMTMEAGNGLFQMIAGDTGASMSVNQSGATTNDWTLGGTNLNLFLGDSAADTVSVPGSLSVTGVKNFVQNHPERPDLSVVYTALEGGEAGTYTRGAGRLDDGVARIALEPTFAMVTYPAGGLTAHVTPRGEWADLYVESVSTDRLVVRGRAGGVPDAAFDYVVYGLRIGYEARSPIQERLMDGTVPVAARDERFYQRHEELRELAPVERFRRMDSDIGGRTARGDVTGADDAERDRAERAIALRRAIGEHETDDGGSSPDVDAEGVAGVARAVRPRRDAASVVGEGPEQAHRAPVDGSATAGDRAVRAYADSLTTVDSELAASVEVGDAVEPGDLVVVDPRDPSRVSPASRVADPTVVGIVAGRPGVLLGDAGTGATAALAFSGIVMAKVDAGFGAIRVGDLLTSSPTPGHAMRADEPLPGTIVGKALESLDAGTGRIRVLVMLR